jgi:hypothetical protein
MNRFGGTTPDAETLLRTAKHGRRSTVRRTGGPGDAIWSSWSAEDSATVDEGAISGDPPAVDSHRLEHGTAGEAGARLLAWMDVRAVNAWGDREHADVAAAAVDARLRAAIPVPDGLGPALSSAWSVGEWAGFDVAVGGAPAVLRVLRAGDGTWWHQGPEDGSGSTPLRAMPVWSLLDALFGGGLPG